MLVPNIPKLLYLLNIFPFDSAVQIELEDGIPILRASQPVQNRIGALLDKQNTSPLSPTEEQELDRYEEIDDYLSFVNRTIRNLYTPSNQACNS